MPAPILPEHTAQSLSSSSFPEQLPDRPEKPIRIKNFIDKRCVQITLCSIGAVGLIVITLFIGAMLGKKPFKQRSCASDDTVPIGTLHSTVTSYTMIATKKLPSTAQDMTRPVSDRIFVPAMSMYTISQVYGVTTSTTKPGTTLTTSFIAGPIEPTVIWSTTTTTVPPEQLTAT